MTRSRVPGASRRLLRADPLPAIPGHLIVIVPKRRQRQQTIHTQRQQLHETAELHHAW